MYPVLVEKVINFLNAAREKYPCDVDRNGEITYANANDGTDFDWQVNDRLCEFGWGTPDGKAWTFRCMVYKDGSATTYCYPNGEMSPIDTLEEHLFTEDEAEQLYRMMYRSTDAKSLWDPSLCDIVWEE